VLPTDNYFSQVSLRLHYRSKHRFVLTTSQ